MNVGTGTLPTIVAEAIARGLVTEDDFLAAAEDGIKAMILGIQIGHDDTCPCVATEHIADCACDPMLVVCDPLVPRAHWTHLSERIGWQHWKPDQYDAMVRAAHYEVVRQGQAIEQTGGRS